MGTRRARPPATVDAYIAACLPKVQSILHRIRHSVQDIAPEAEEMISYRMPAYRQGGMLVYFAAFKHHIGLFPPVRGDARLEKAVALCREGLEQFPDHRAGPTTTCAEAQETFRLKLGTRGPMAATRGEHARPLNGSFASGARVASAAARRLATRQPARTRLDVAAVRRVPRLEQVGFARVVTDCATFAYRPTCTFSSRTAARAVEAPDGICLRTDLRGCAASYSHARRARATARSVPPLSDPSRIMEKLRASPYRAA
jgi:uncharacterized protein YdhG (YjbR/CyaY superfamily)